MSLLLQRLNIIEMIVILIMLKARKFDKVVDEWIEMRSMSKKISRWGVSVCRRLELLAKFFNSWCSFAHLSVTPPWYHQWATALLAEVTVFYNSKTYLIMSTQLLIFHLNVYKSHRYNIVLVTITTLWSVARQPNLTINVERYCTFTWYGC